MGFELESKKSTALPTLSPATLQEFQRIVADLTGKGWKITQDGPSGAQLSGPKKMTKADLFCLILGACTVFWGIGFLFILIALFDYWVLTKPQTQFISRPQP